MRDVNTPWNRRCLWNIWHSFDSHWQMAQFCAIWFCMNYISWWAHQKPMIIIHQNSKINN